jgi:hypothetical protein
VNSFRCRCHRDAPRFSFTHTQSHLSRRLAFLPRSCVFSHSGGGQPNSLIMKASALALLLAAPLAAANFNAVFALLKSLGLTKQFECALPCLLEATNKIPCEGKGAVNVICDNVDRIAEDTRPCTEKCKAKRGNGESRPLSPRVIYMLLTRRQTLSSS